MFKRIFFLIVSAVLFSGFLTVSAEDKIQPEKPTAPTFEYITENEIYITKADGYEYKLGDGEWQKSRFFKDLKANTNYAVYQRKAESDTFFASEASEAAIVKTLCGHKWYSLDNCVTKTCEICGETTEANGHDFGSGNTELVPATPESDGGFTEKCSVCELYGEKLTNIPRIDRIEVEDTEYTFNPNEYPKPGVKAYDINGNLISDSEYTIQYYNTSVSNPRVVVEFSGHYSGTLEKPFTIKPMDISGVNFKLDSTMYYYNKNGVKPTVIASVGSKKIDKGNFEYSYTNNTKVGTATVKITGKGNYTGSKTISFKIYPKVSAQTVEVYEGKKISFKGYSADSIKYTVADSKIIKYSGGKITALKPGTTTIKVTSNGLSVSVKVKVKKIKFSTSTVLTYNGYINELMIQGDSYSNYTWSSSNKSIVKVSSKGKITPLKAGTCYIYAKNNKRTLKCKVTVMKYYEGSSVLDFGAFVGKIANKKIYPMVHYGYYMGYGDVSKSQIESYKKALVSLGFKYKGKKVEWMDYTTYTYSKNGVTVNILTVSSGNGYDVVIK